MIRHSVLTPVEASQVHAAAVAANLHPVRIEADLHANLTFYAGERAFEQLTDWLEHAHHLAQLRRAEVSS